MEEFAVGDIVDVKGYGRAEVIEPLCTDENSRFHGRYRVRYQRDGKTYYSRPESLRRTATQVKQRVLLCHSTTHYRTCAASVINYDDAVLEVGSHEGECTFLMSRRCRYIVGVDKSEVTIKAARKRYPGLRFEAVDGFDMAALKALGPPEGFSVVLVDIGGIASLPTVAALVGLYYKEFPWNTKIVVKSVFLKRMMEDCLPYNPAPSNPWQLTGGAGAAGAVGSAAAEAGQGGAKQQKSKRGQKGAAGGAQAKAGNAGDAGDGAAAGPSSSAGTAAAAEEMVFNGPRRNGRGQVARADRPKVSASASAAAAAAAAAAAMGGGGAAGEGQGRGGGGQGGRGRGGRGRGRGEAGAKLGKATETAAGEPSVAATASEA
ncbi:hypothetical protein HYH02_009822 [Chlamydomonas schloesseri]|uniref:Methyltransferase domain-containing protein n=1 Tax=Chlamydomonas schloesseri TaxID=2026947 RepID=A0A835W782_9CHLO|nr:hypothetical protein HYH02_009822 [Chlamydomonas schloesseri]|eukprot:KAG2442030.1 hypothetical protein HYH02_009822 [Chlamydomonas schloesseri]